MWLSLSWAVESLWGNRHSEVWLGFGLSPRDPPGQFVHSQPVPIIYDSKINTFQAERGPQSVFCGADKLWL